MTTAEVVLGSFGPAGLREFEASVLLAPVALRGADSLGQVLGFLPIGLIRLQSREAFALRLFDELGARRRGTFEPQLIAKYQRRFPGFDDKIISMYARGMSVRDIQGHLRELYGIEASPQLISTVTDAVLEEVGRWQARPLDALYAIVFFDALRVKMRDEGTVRNKAVYLAIGVTPDGRKDVLGIWIEQTEGAKFWMRVMSELKNRGINDVLIAVVDGLKGFPDAISAVFPETQIQTCIVHLLRNSMDYAGWKDRKPVATALKAVYRAVDAATAASALTEFEEGPWGREYPAITAAWRRNWAEVIPFFAYPLEVRRMIYTTNAIESLNSTIRRSVRARGHFPSDEAALKPIWLQLREVTNEWKMPAREWHAARAQFASVLDSKRISKSTGPNHTEILTPPKTVPLLAQLKAWLDHAVHTVLPRDTFEIAVNYALKHWEALTNFTKAGHLDASNNYAERCMRTVAVGRKAFLFVGSERAGHAAAIYYSLVESCEANQVNPLTYLTYVLANARNKSITLPTPDEFKASNIAHVG